MNYSLICLSIFVLVASSFSQFNTPTPPGPYFDLHHQRWNNTKVRPSIRFYFIGAERENAEISFYESMALVMVLPFSNGSKLKITESGASVPNSRAVEYRVVWTLPKDAIGANNQQAICVYSHNEAYW